MYIIRRIDHAARWVNQPGSKNAYTNRREKARTFPTRDSGPG